jgi:hypothetical protein
MRRCAEQPIVFDFVTQAHEWKCFHVEPVLPGATIEGIPAGLRLQLRGPPQRLLPYAMRKGFANIKGHWLRKLHDVLVDGAGDGDPPSAEGPLLQALGRHIFAEQWSEELMKEVVDARTASSESMSPVDAQSPLLVGDAQDVLQEEMEGMDLDEELQNYQEKLRCMRLAAQLRAEQLADSVGKCAAAAEAAAAPHHVKKAIVWPPGGLTQAQAKGFLPPGASISKETTWHQRWRVESPELGQRSKSFRGEDVQADHEACRAVLRLVWAAYTQVHGGECPWQLDAADAGVPA